MIRLVVGHHALTPEQQLACDEALLNLADRNVVGPSLRLWRFDRPVVVLGRSSRVSQEVRRDYCRSHGIPWLRRCSGGAAIVGGPGCLMYSAVVGLDDRPELRGVDRAHHFVMSRVLQAIRHQQPEADWQGICDLTWKGRKFSGNSLRIARHHLLYHGTVLLRVEPADLAACLGEPPRQPDYRGRRPHADFVTHLPCDSARLSNDLMQAFDVKQSVDVASAPWSSLLDQEMGRLIHERYGRQDWHDRR